MSVRIRRETIASGGILRALPQNTAVEAEAALPGGLRDEVRVFYTAASAVPVSAEAVGGKLHVGGRVLFRALYAQGDLTRVRAVEATSDFTRQLALPASANGAQFAARCEVTNAASRVFNGRLLLRAEMALYAEAEETAEASVVTAVEEDGAQTLTRDITTQRAVGAGAEQGLIRGEFELSEVLQATETLLSDAEVRVEDILGGEDGRATVTGTIDIAACHASSMPGRPLVCTRHSMPFEQTVTLSGEMGDMLLAQARVTDVAAVSQEAENGQILRAEVGLNVTLTALREQTERAVTDVFGTADDTLAPVREQIAWRARTLNEHAAESARVQLILPESAPRIKTVLAAFSHPVLIGATAQGGKLTSDLLMQNTLLYMTEDSGIPVSYSAEEPLRVTFSCPAEPDDALTLSASHVEGSAVAGDRAEVRSVVTLHADGARYEQAQTVTNVEKGEPTEKGGSLSMYITEPGDRLWDVMKRYRLSREALEAFNEQLMDVQTDAPLAPGTRVIAYRR